MFEASKAKPNPPSIPAPPRYVEYNKLLNALSNLNTTASCTPLWVSSNAPTVVLKSADLVEDAT